MTGNLPSSPFFGVNCSPLRAPPMFPRRDAAANQRILATGPNFTGPDAFTESEGRGQSHFMPTHLPASSKDHLEAGGESQNGTRSSAGDRRHAHCRQGGHHAAGGAAAPLGVLGLALAAAAPASSHAAGAPSSDRRKGRRATQRRMQGPGRLGTEMGQQGELGQDTRVEPSPAVAARLALGKPMATPAGSPTPRAPSGLGSPTERQQPCARPGSCVRQPQVWGPPRLLRNAGDLATGILWRAESVGVPWLGSPARARAWGAAAGPGSVRLALLAAGAAALGWAVVSGFLSSLALLRGRQEEQSGPRALAPALGTRQQDSAARPTPTPQQLNHRVISPSSYGGISVVPPVEPRSPAGLTLQAMSGTGEPDRLDIQATTPGANGAVLTQPVADGLQPASFRNSGDVAELGAEPSASSALRSREALLEEEAAAVLAENGGGTAVGTSRVAWGPSDVAAAAAAVAEAAVGVEKSEGGSGTSSPTAPSRSAAQVSAVGAESRALFPEKEQDSELNGAETRSPGTATSARVPRTSSDAPAAAYTGSSEPGTEAGIHQRHRTRHDNEELITLLQAQLADAEREAAVAKAVAQQLLDGELQREEELRELRGRLTEAAAARTDGQASPGTAPQTLSPELQALVQSFTGVLEMRLAKEAAQRQAAQDRLLAATLEQRMLRARLAQAASGGGASASGAGQNATVHPPPLTEDEDELRTDRPTGAPGVDGSPPSSPQTAASKTGGSPLVAHLRSKMEAAQVALFRERQRAEELARRADDLERRLQQAEAERDALHLGNLRPLIEQLTTAQQLVAEQARVNREMAAMMQQVMEEAPALQDELAEVRLELAKEREGRRREGDALRELLSAARAEAAELRVANVRLEQRQLEKEGPKRKTPLR